VESGAARDATRIVLATDAYLPWSGGSRVYYHNLYSRLAEHHGYEVSVLTSHTDGDTAFDRAAERANLQFVRRGHSLPDWRYSRAPRCAAHLMRLAAFLAREAPHALHCGDLVPQAANAWLLHRLTGRPYLVFVHGDEISQTDKRKHQPKLRNAIYRNAAALVAANPYALAHLERILGSTERCHLLPPGVDSRCFFQGEPSLALREDWRRHGAPSAPASPILLTAARLVKKKGHETLLRSVRMIVGEFPGLRYVIAGDGPERPVLERQVAEAGLAGHVIFAGDVPHERLGDYYRSADVFAMANCTDASGDVESFGMTFVEANACGKPVIGGRSGGTGAAVSEDITGLLCTPGNAEEFAAALRLLLRDPGLRQRMGRAGACRAQKQFQWESRARELHAITQAMLPSASRPRSYGRPPAYDKDA
jgi:phosphatidylinositol alpha-1,6-mannosyltransferase